MGMYRNPYGFPGQVAGGTIAPKRFVKMSTSADNTVLQATANDRCDGVSQQGQRDAPGLTGSDAVVAAAAGDQIDTYTPGDLCYVVAGASGCTRSVWVKSDSAGKATPVTTLAGSGSSATLQNAAGIVVRGGASGEDVLIFFFPQQITQ